MFTTPKTQHTDNKSHGSIKVTKFDMGVGAPEDIPVVGNGLKTIKCPDFYVQKRVPGVKPDW